MADNFVSRKDRIIASAIDIINESGLSALTAHNLALKENSSETLMYKYFCSIDDVLIEVVEYYQIFDRRIQQTVEAKTGRYIEKLLLYVDAYATYYENYFAISTLMLQYEELLHNTHTRDKISNCIIDRNKFIESLFDKAISNGEIVDVMSAQQLAEILMGIIMTNTLNRRIVYCKRSFKNELMDSVTKWFSIIKK